EPLPFLPKLLGAEPNDTSKDDISLADLTLTLTFSNEIKKVSDKRKMTRPLRTASHFNEEVKGLKEQINKPPDTSPSVSQLGCSKSAKGKQKTWFGPYKQCGFRNHLSKDCYMKPKCSTCGSTDHLNKEHPEQAAIKKTLAKLKAQSSQGSSSRKAPMIPKPFKDCKYCGFNDHHSDECEYYPRCDICGSIAHETTDCPKVVFGDKSLGDTEGYGSVNCNGITFTRVEYVNGLKHNLISISQLCDATFKVLFTKTQGTISNKNNEVVLITPRRWDVYVINMSSYNEESNVCFFAKTFNSVN
ncbi:hypothetical protein Tco_1557661, partial [Tanacetum coccineum]